MREVSASVAMIVNCSDSQTLISTCTNCSQEFNTMSFLVEAHAAIWAAFCIVVCSTMKPARTLEMVTVEAKPREYRNLLPLPCFGRYSPNSNENLPCVFLGLERMVCQDRGDGSCIGRGLIPIPIPTGYESALSAAMETFSVGAGVMINSGSTQPIAERNGGIFDNFDTQTRKLINNRLRHKDASPSSYHSLVQALETCAKQKVCGLLVELADAPAPNVLVLGGAVLIADSTAAHNWRLDYKHTSAIKATRGSTQAQLVKCAMDEVVGLAFATNLPVVIPTKLYDSGAVDGLLAQEPKSLQIEVTAPYFSTVQEAALWAAEQPAMQKRNSFSRSQAPVEAKQTPRAEEISDASTFLRMSTVEKRDVLRATGVRGNAMPRPREGKRAVDALLIPLLDEEVAYEVLRRLAETRGDFAQAARMSDFETRKPQIARLILQAKQRGDTLLARQLCEELNSLSTLKFDPTNPYGAPGEWDVEEWYWEQRKRAYGIIAA